MEFLGIGYQEVLLILVLMLVVVGPERLPGMAYQIGRAVRTMQQYARAVRAEFSEEIGYLEEQYKTVKGEIDTTRSELRDQQTKFEAGLRDAKSALDVPELSGGSNVINLSDAARREASPEPAAAAPEPASQPQPPKGDEAPAAPLVF